MVALLVSLPLPVLAIVGMVFLFQAGYGRQRVYGALPEIGRRTLEGRAPGPYAPYAGNRGRPRGSFAQTTSLDASEVQACRMAGYSPLREMRRASVRVDVEWRGAGGAGFLSRVRHSTGYAVSTLSEGR